MKKRLLTLGLSSTLALSSIMPAFANAISSNDDKTYIETAIGFKYPELIDDLKSKNLKATLTGNSINITVDLNQFLDNSSSTTIDGYTITPEVIKENDKVTIVKFKIENLPAYDNYNLKVDGKNYATTVVNLSTATYSKRVNISTATNMVLGDINKDNKVDISDRKLLEDNLNNINEEYDLNNDNKITASDIAIVNANMVNISSPEIFETEMVASKVIENIKQDEISKVVDIKEGDDIKNLFTENGSVSFKPKENEKNLSIPLEFNTVQEMSSVVVTIPEGAESAEVVLYDENNNIIQPAETSPALFTRARTNQQVVVVNLGARKPVKKISINVVPAQNNEYVVIDAVKLIGDIVNEDIVQDNVVKNIKAIADSEQVSLSWRPVNNVTGYKVYYGTDQNNLDQVTTTDVPNITITGLNNLTTYYFSISAISGDWEGEKSAIVSATPLPKKAPNRPDFVKATANDGSITLSWNKAENAESYNIYSKTSKDSEYKKVASNITNTSYTLSGLTNNVEYTLYVTSENSVGESTPSELINATPKKDIVTPPTLPTKDRIPNSNIEKVEMGASGNFDSALYPNGFDPKWLIDENFNTDWVARVFWETNTFSFTFKQPKTMDYLIWAPRLDGEYKNSNENYTITVWTDGQDLNGAGTIIAKDYTITEKFDENKYYALTFPKTENIKKISIKLGERTGGPRVNGSEVAFYEYNDIADRISNLFANSSRTELKKEVTKEKIEELKNIVNNTDGFVVDKNILLKELDIATSLLNNNKEALGVIKDNIYSINPQNDIKNYGISINNWQPLGVVGNAGKKVVIYADIPEGETVSLVATQFFEEADKLSSAPITLKNGRNIITIPKLGNINTDRGGSLYVTYTGEKASQIKLQVVGAHKIPYLELRDFHKLQEKEIKERITKFIEELIAYNPNGLPGNKEWQLLNQAEISLPNVLLSLPANKVLEGINQNVSSLEEKVNKMYDNVKAWEELMGVMYKTYGIDDHKNASLETRHNIRYMKMFANAFMYASGNHIGIQYGSVAPLMNGKPVNEQTPNERENNLFGWGIAHEIGHVMDKLGKAEVTNNIFSLMGQTYDGKQNTLPSRLELNNVYDKIFKKVSVGNEGIPNDLFTHLGMYWQLHLAYDDGENPFMFYNELYKLYRTDNSLNSFRDMDKFAVAASKVAKKDLTEFFTRWGVSLSESAKTEIAKQEKETRAIYYITDQSRRERLNNNEGNKNIIVSASSAINPENPKEIIVTIDEKNNQNVQGYEIIRNGKGIGFTTTNTYKDFIGSANNMAFTYEVVPVDILGNISDKQPAGQVKISYDNTINTSLYKIDENTGIVTFNEPTVVTGIKVTPKDSNTEMPTGKYTVYADIAEPVSPVSEAETIPDGFNKIAKNGDFANNFASAPKTYINYFNRPGSTEDKIWAYDVTRLKLTGFDFKKYNVEFLSYPGDNVEFMNMGVGRLANDYIYDSVDENGQPIKEKIAKDTLVIIGNYRGNSALSNIYIKGKYATQNSLIENPTTEERVVSGYTLMLDTLDEDGTITSSTAGGIFIFVPEIQGENEDKNHQHEGISDLPTEIMAEMWQGEFNGENSRMTSNTTWSTMPSDDSLPLIVLQNGEDNTPKITIK
ncbi:M60 family metallopeptidase [[Clostridium] colinum]|uniref:M60 family metallopeptidase n=1 Tax=[Clostridium] colinum TaxID=36835 RepID=UPI0020248E2C|nr:M60 family metallopeptidase [[Clostridium] colinum]